MHLVLDFRLSLPNAFDSAALGNSLNNLKILTRFGRHYETPLLIQSVLMNIAMFALVHLCVNINARDVIIKMEERVFTGR